MSKAKPTPPRATKKIALLNRDHYDAIDAALRRLADLPQWIDAAELCDVDCQEYRQGHAYLVEKLAKIRDHFFPQGRPAS